MLFLNNISEIIINLYIIDPLEQFSIVPVLWINLICASQITNMTIVVSLNLLIITLFLTNSLNKGKNTILYTIMCIFFNLVKNIFKGNTSLKRNEYFTIYFYLFLFICCSNLMGLLPYSFTVTSSFSLTFFLSLTMFIGINLIGIIKNKWENFNLFLPSGIPLAVSIMLVPIELISYSSRTFSLSIRLFANMMSGHALLKILVSFAFKLLTTSLVGIVFAAFPWIVISLSLSLEVLICFLQAYVFVILTTIYLNEVITEDSH